MKAKEYLSQAYRLDKRINSKIDQVASLNDLATKCTSNVTGMPKSPNQGNSTVADAVVKIIDLQAEINRDIDRLVDLKCELTRTIKAVDDVDCQLLLEGRYLCYKSWEQIAVELGFRVRHVYEVHSKALNKIEKILSAQ